MGARLSVLAGLVAGILVALAVHAGVILAVPATTPPSSEPNPSAVASAVDPVSVAVRLAFSVAIGGSQSVSFGVLEPRGLPCGIGERDEAPARKVGLRAAIQASGRHNVDSMTQSEDARPSASTSPRTSCLGQRRTTGLPRQSVASQVRQPSDRNLDAAARKAPEFPKFFRVGAIIDGWRARSRRAAICASQRIIAASCAPSSSDATKKAGRSNGIRDLSQVTIRG